MKKIKPMCYVGNEYLDKCPACKGKVNILKEGTPFNGGVDVVECDCTHWELPNSMDFMGNKLTFGAFKQSKLV